MFDIKKVEDEAKAEIAKEQAEKAKTALVKKLRDLENAKRIVANIQREIDDLKASIADGSFTG
ncbi:MAG: hypothetical protein KGL39_59745 [Patescibacteria group bacterium]|nr:hypothetical protein [Patescibacteria group bacterium]